MTDLLTEHAWDHQFGQPLATIKDTTIAHTNKTLQEGPKEDQVTGEKLSGLIVAIKRALAKEGYSQVNGVKTPEQLMRVLNNLIYGKS